VESFRRGKCHVRFVVIQMTAMICMLKWGQFMIVFEEDNNYMHAVGWRGFVLLGIL
jgi:hypothetical protein